MALTAPNLGRQSFADVCAASSSLASVILIRRENILGWILGMVASIMLSFSFFVHDLPGQAWLQLGWFVPLQAAAIVSWTCGHSQPVEAPETAVSTLRRTERLTISSLSSKGLSLAIISTLALTILVTTVLYNKYGGSFSVRLWDASILASSVTAQLLLARKKIENWVFWIVPVNLSSIAMHVAAGIPLHVILYGCFLVNAALGLRQWRNKAAYALPAST